MVEIAVVQKYFLVPSLKHDVYSIVGVTTVLCNKNLSVCLSLVKIGFKLCKN